MDSDSASDLRLSRHLRPQPPTAPPRCAPRAARSARSSGTSIGHHPRRPSLAAPAPRSLSVLRHAGSAAHDGQASRLTHPRWCRVQHVVPEEVAQVAVVVVVFPVWLYCAVRRTSITVGEAESCEHTDQASQGFDSTPASKYLNSTPGRA